ncbi:hypothetical protein N7454_008639 [Penicillium verhagenii]|nr:hypothetical protein N7454_008639 [Penicillium verhagenii]
MPESPIHNHPATSVAGGTSATPTPANNVGGGSGWGDSGFKKGGFHEGGGPDAAEEPRQGWGHPPNARGTMGQALGLQEQKTHAKYHFLSRADDAAASTKPMSTHGEPTCAGEDHSFMTHKPGGSDTMPGWGTFRNVLGA